MEDEDAEEVAVEDVEDAAWESSEIGGITVVVVVEAEFVDELFSKAKLSGKDAVVEWDEFKLELFMVLWLWFRSLL